MTRYFLITMLVLAAACSDKDKSSPLPFESIGSSKNQPGIGPNDGEPLGTAFTLPAGTRFVQRPNHRFDPDLDKLFGNANTFYVDVHLVNDDTVKGDRMIEFQPGLVMMDVAPGRIQNGMLMDRVLINMPPTGSGPGGVNDTVTVYLGVVCLNEDRGVPWGDNQEDDTRDYPIAKGMYLPSVVTSDPNLLRLISLLDGKDLRLKRHYNPREIFDEHYIEPEWMQIYSMIQKMVWKITEENGLGKEDIRELTNALNAYQ
ncbi:hypothetical protein [Chitinophaga barathri]|uniref:Uncharacterized protein n=1 Tax=Chitinophaga barathri TaxID=1647451 RepID=A0A3N4ME64_9BACT|nr:hypothetical protein [Chitinophaga barathri]RPD42071.1 hypothetical protein EG028_07935 [Chitinophaga barathri]